MRKEKIRDFIFKGLSENHSDIIRTHNETTLTRRIRFHGSYMYGF